MKRHNQGQSSGQTRKAGNTDTLFNLPVSVAGKYQGWRPGLLKETLTGETDEATPTSSGLSNDETLFLKTVVDNPGRPCSAYPKLARIGSRKAVEIRKRLVASGWIRETKVKTKPRGRASILIEATQRALELFKKGND